MAAVDGGTVAMQGQATAVAPASVVYEVEAAVSGDAAVTGEFTGTFNMAASVAGSADTIVTPGVFKLIDAALVGEATVVAPAQFLVYADLVGQASASAQAELALSAVSAVSGQATTTQEGNVVFGVNAAVSGDAEVTPAAVVTYVAAAAVTGDAALAAAALEDDEIAADARASSEAAGNVGVNYAVEATVTGSSSILPVGLLRPVLLPQALPVPNIATSPRLIGLQPGRAPHQRDDRFRVSTDPTFLRNRRTNDEVAASTQTGRVRTQPQDAASRAFQQRVREGFNPNGEG